MDIHPFEIWIADLSSRFTNDPQKIRPVVIIRTNLLEEIQPAVLICPITTKVKSKPTPIRINLEVGEFGIERQSAIMIDKIGLIGVKRLRNKVGTLSDEKIQVLKDNIKIILDFEQP